MKIEAKGTIKKILFEGDNDYKVLKVAVSEINGENGYGKHYVLTGAFPKISKEDEIFFIAEKVKHYKYGEQLKLMNYKIEMPSTEKTIKSFLINFVPGVGKVMADRIYSRYGLGTLSSIKNDENALIGIKGMGEELRLKIRNVVLSLQQEEDFLSFTFVMDIPVDKAMRYYKANGSSSLISLKLDPYTGLEAGFKIEECDNIAKHLLMPYNSEKRVNALVKEFLKKDTVNGNIYTDKEYLLENLNSFTPRDIYKEDISANHILFALDSLNKNDIIIENETNIYRAHYYYYENSIARDLISMANERNYIEKEKIERSCKKYNLDATQSEAVEKSLSHGISVITGAAGTGKTHILNAIIDVVGSRKISLLAPTGKAANRMQESTGMDAQTIHRKLKLTEDGNGYSQDEIFSEEIEYVIVDEASMIDMNLFFKLMMELDTSFSLILLGDYNQLPSVGAGLILRDIIESEVIPTTKLINIYRQSDESGIIDLANSIIDEEEIVNFGKGITFVETTNDEESLEKVLELYDDETQVLSTMRNGDIGINNLNMRIQKQLYPNIDKIGLYEKTRVIHLENNYELDVFNGEIGIVSSTNDRTGIIIINYDDRNVFYTNASDKNQLDLAYALTIHKSQGSEFKRVILPISSEKTFMNTKNLLYTAITRASEELVIIGNKEDFNKFCKVESEIFRNTGLKDRLIKLNEKGLL